jgi:hypothetical protein
MAKRKKAASGIPEGMRQVQSGKLAPFHDFSKRNPLDGVVVAIRSFTDRWKKKNRAMDIADSETAELTSVTESAGLRGLFDSAKKGDRIWIRYDGQKKIKGRNRPMREYTTAIQDGNA